MPFSLLMESYRWMAAIIKSIQVVAPFWKKKSVFVLVGGFTCLCPSGHAPHQLYMPLLCYSIPFHPHPLPRLMHTSRRDPFVPNSLLRWCHRCSSRRGQTTVQTTSGH